VNKHRHSISRCRFRRGKWKARRFKENATWYSSGFSHLPLFYKTEKKKTSARVTNFWLMWLVVILSGNTKLVQCKYVHLCLQCPTARNHADSVYRAITASTIIFILILHYEVVPTWWKKKRQFFLSFLRAESISDETLIRQREDKIYASKIGKSRPRNFSVYTRINLTYTLKVYRM